MLISASTADTNRKQEAGFGKKTRLEVTIRSLESEKLDLQDIIEEKSLTPEQYQDIQEFSRRIIEGIDLVSCNFKTKKQIIELLDIQVQCMIDNEGKNMSI